MTFTWNSRLFTQVQYFMNLKALSSCLCYWFTFAITENFTKVCGIVAGFNLRKYLFHRWNWKQPQRSQALHYGLQQWKQGLLQHAKILVSLTLGYGYGKEDTTAVKERLGFCSCPLKYPFL